MLELEILETKLSGQDNWCLSIHFVKHEHALKFMETALIYKPTYLSMTDVYEGFTMVDININDYEKMKLEVKLITVVGVEK